MQEVLSEKQELKSKFQEKFAFLYDPKSLFYHVLLLIGVGLLYFGICLAFEQFTTPFSGDYSQQYFAFEYNFYDDWWTFFKTGKFPLYDSNTFLGADNIISNTYYGLFSPFTFPILFFPRSFIPHAMALMTIAKLVTGSLIFRVYLKKMGASETSARIFSIAYAFMGWTAYYLWFFNFGEVLTFFPIILLGIEKIIKDKSIWLCSLGFFLMGLGNYFFLLTFGIFGVIYAAFRFFQTFKERGGTKAWKDHLIVFGLGIAGFSIGFLLGSIVLIPAITGSFSISRASTGNEYIEILKAALNEKDYGQFLKIIFTYWHPNVVGGSRTADEYYFAFAFPLASYFYPTLSGRYVTIVGYSAFENAGSSIFFFTPCLILMGCSVYRSFKLKKISHFIAIALCVFCLFVPFFYFLSGAFTNNYGRWQIIVPALGLVYIALNFDHRDEIPRPVVLISGLVALIGMIGTFLLALKLTQLYPYLESEPHKYHLYDLDDNFRIGVVIYEVTLCIVETYLFAGLWKKAYFNRVVKFIIVGEAIVLGNIIPFMHGLQDIRTDVNGGLTELDNRVSLVEKINKEDKSFFRMYSSVADDRHVNIPEADNYNGLTTFHTFYNNEVDDFIHMVSMTSWEKSWSSHYLYKHQYLESFLGVKYYLTKNSDTSYYNPDRFYEPNVPLNYSLYINDEEHGYRVYKNDHHIDFGMSYDTLYYKHRVEDDPVHNAFYDHSALSLSDKLRNEEVLFKGVILNDEDLEEINQQYPDNFVVKDEVPSREMNYFNANIKGIYAAYKINEEGQREYIGFNPSEPTKYLNGMYRVNTEDDKIPVKYYQMVYDLGEHTTFPTNESGCYYVLAYPIRSNYHNYNAVVWLLDENDKVILFDELRYDEADYNNVGRALYSPVPVSKMIICPVGGEFVNSDVTMYYETYDKVLYKLDKAKDNGIYDITYDVNDFTFKTNYESEMFVVTQLAYTKGWRIKATLEDGNQKNLKIYNSQGGFAGFVAPKGAVSYELTYLTDGLGKWAILSMAAFLCFSASIVVPIVINKRKEKRGKPL